MTQNSEKELWVLEWLQLPLKLSMLLTQQSDQIWWNLLTNNFSSWKNIKTDRILWYIISLSNDLEYFFKNNTNAEIYFDIENWFYWKDWWELENTPWWQLLQEWFDEINPIFEEFKKNWEWKHVEEYLDFSNWIIYWAIWGIWIWFWADIIWLNQNNIVEWVVRFISWNWDTIWWLIQRIKNKIKWWKENTHLDSFSIWWVAGMWFWPTLQAINEWIWNNWALASTIYTSAYSNADNLFSWIWSLSIYIKENWIKNGLKEFWDQPFQKANIMIITWLFVLNLLFHTLSNNIIDDQTKAAIHWTILNIDSLVAAAYMRYYASQQYRKFIFSIWNWAKIKKLVQKYNIES